MKARVKNLPNLISGIGLGAAIMYVFDPQRGTSRRAVVRDKAVRALHETQDALDVASRDLVHRAQGIVAEARHLFDHMPVEDDVLVARVRSQMGRLVSHPGLIEVTARNGQITLSGLILEDELARLLSAAKSVRGVSGVINRLDTRDAIRTAYHPPATGALTRSDWTPAAKLLAVIAGGGMIGSGAALRGRGMVLTGIGASILARGLFGNFRQLLSSRDSSKASESSSSERNPMSHANVIPISRPLPSAHASPEQPKNTG